MRGRPVSPRPPRTIAVAALLAFALISATAGERAGASITPLPEDQSIVVTGGGWGHGHGMSQYGARAMAVAGKTWQQIVANYYRNTSIAAEGNTAIRVLVNSGSSVIVGGDYPYTAKWSGGTTIGSSTSTYPYMRVRPLSSGVIVERAASLSGPWTTVATSTQIPRFFPSSGLIAVQVAGQTRVYREMIEANRRGSTLIYAINQLTMDHYLYGVVGREMPSSWPAEGLKAQAVAARSYAMYKRAHTTTVYDICANTGCQSYGGYAYKSAGSSTYTTLEVSSVRAAVDETTGLAAVYNGAPIFAEFNSSSGGYTGPGGYPYLSPVPDPWDATYSPYYRWTSTITVASIESHWPALGRFAGFGAVARDGYGAWGGRVNSMTLLGTSSNVTVSGAGFQSAYGLRSRLFTPAIYDATVVSIPDGVSLAPGQTTTVSVRLKNTGNVSWPVGGAVQLGTAGPLNRTSLFQAPNWPSPTRAARVTRNLSRSGATTIAPGDVAEFSLSLTASPASTGLFSEQFRPVEDTAWFSKPFTITIRVGVVGFPSLGGNLVDNPSFERSTGSDPAAWTETIGTGDDTATSASIDGVRSLTIAGDPSSRKNFVQQIGLSGVAGDAYSLSAWNRTMGSDPSGTPAAVTVKFRYTDGSYDWQQIIFPAGDHAWTAGQTTVTAAKPYARIDVYTEYFTQTGTTWFDRITLSRTLVQNPSFEASTAGWGIPASGAGRDSTQAASGRSSLHVSAIPTKTVYAAQSVPVAGSAGQTFVLSGWNRTTGTVDSGGGVFVVAAVRYIDGTTGFFTIQFPRIAHGWTYGEIPFTTAKPFSRIDLNTRMDRQSGDGWFDDVRLAPTDDTMVENGGFENGVTTPDAWAISGTGRRDTSLPLAGTAVLRLDAVATKNIYAIQRVAFPGHAGDTFTLSSWNRTSGTSSSLGRVALAAAVRNTDGTTNFFVVDFSKDPHGWTSAETRFTATKAFNAVDLYPQINGQTGTAWFDEVRLARAKDTLSDNAGFEAGAATPSSWSLSGSGARDTTDPFAGDASLRLQAVTTKSIYGVQSVPVSGGAGSRFLLSGWNRTAGTSSARGRVSLIAAVRNSDGTTSFFLVDFARAPHGWIYGQVPFTAPKAFSRIDLYTQIDVQTGSAWFDEVHLAPLR